MLNQEKFNCLKFFPKNERNKKKLSVQIIEYLFFYF